MSASWWEDWDSPEDAIYDTWSSTCPATLADKGRVPCTATTIHNPHHGCRFELIDADVNRDHEEDE